MRSLPLMFLMACATAPRPVADPNGPHAANEAVTGFGGTLTLDAFPQNGVEVSDSKIYVWVFVEGAPGSTDALHAQAKQQATEQLNQFGEVITQQLELQLQQAGLDSATLEELAAVKAQFSTTLSLGEGERAWQNLTREDQQLCRVFVRYALSADEVRRAIASNLGTRKSKEDIASRVLASFNQ